MLGIRCSNLTTQGRAAQAADAALEQPTIDTTELVTRGEPLLVDSEAGESLDTKILVTMETTILKKGQIGNGYGRKRVP